MTQPTDDFADAASALAGAIAGAVNDPADAVRLLLPLTAWVPPPIRGTGPLAARARAAQAAIADTLRTAACAALGSATLAYNPVSYQDAQAVRGLVCAALDAQATRLADAGRSASYEALRDLRASIAMDLALRGANLAWLVEVTTLQSVPSLAEAWTLYQDTTREPEITASADAPHPLFLPTSFPALNQ
jgi:prophage DNA circulation protein